MIATESAEGTEGVKEYEGASQDVWSKRSVDEKGVRPLDASIFGRQPFCSGPREADCLAKLVGGEEQLSVIGCWLLAISGWSYLQRLKSRERPIRISY